MQVLRSLVLSRFLPFLIFFFLPCFSAFFWYSSLWTPPCYFPCVCSLFFVRSSPCVYLLLAMGTSTGYCSRLKIRCWTLLLLFMMVACWEEDLCCSQWQLVERSCCHWSLMMWLKIKLLKIVLPLLGRGGYCCYPKRRDSSSLPTGCCWWKLLKHRLKAYIEKRRSSYWTEGKKEMKASPATPAESLGGGREQKVG